MGDWQLERLFISSVFAGTVLMATCASAQERSSVFTGIDGTANGWGSYVGFVSALNGDLDTSGWTTTTVLGYSQYSDNFSVPKINTNSLTASVMMGYVWVQPDYYLTLNLGVDLVNNSETPSTGSRTEGTHVGAIAQIGFETTQKDALYFNGFGSYMTANERLFTQLRVGYKARNFTYGLEGTYSSEIGSSGSMGLGVFMSGLQLGAGEVGFSLGYLNERGSTAYDSPYVALEYSIPVRF